MPFGRRSSSSSSPSSSPSNPTNITKAFYSNALGDVFKSVRRGSKQSFSTQLSGPSQNLVNQSLQGSQTLLRELNASPQQRQNQLQQLADRQFNRQARALQQQTDRIRAKARGRLAQRFGRSGNSTFGNTLLAQVETAGLNSLIDERLRADLMVDDRLRADDRGRLQRLGAFQNVLNSYNNNAKTFATLGDSTLSQEASLATRRFLGRLQQQTRLDLGSRPSLNGVSQLLNSGLNITKFIDSKIPSGSNES